MITMDTSIQVFDGTVAYGSPEQWDQVITNYLESMHNNALRASILNILPALTPKFNLLTRDVVEPPLESDLMVFKGRSEQRCKLLESMIIQVGVLANSEDLISSLTSSMACCRYAHRTELP
jgi:hypothetical protein